MPCPLRGTSSLPPEPLVALPASQGGHAPTATSRNILQTSRAPEQRGDFTGAATKLSKSLSALSFTDEHALLFAPLVSKNCFRSMGARVVLQPVLSACLPALQRLEPALFVLPRGSRAADALPAAFKAHFPLPQKGLKAAEAGQGSQNIVFRSIPFYLLPGSSLRPLFPPVQVVWSFGCEGQWEGRAQGQLVPFTLWEVPRLSQHCPHAVPWVFPLWLPSTLISSGQGA